MIKPIKNNVLFEFIDKSKYGLFMESSKSGIVLNTATTDTQQDDRWARVVSIGPDVTCVNVDNIVLIQALQWTQGAVINDTVVWKTDDTKLIAISDTDKHYRF